MKLDAQKEPWSSSHSQALNCGSCWQVRVLQQYVSEQGTTSAALNYDFGLITLASAAPAGTTSMNIEVGGTGDSVSYDLTTAGYPADKPSQTMWQVGLWDPASGGGTSDSSQSDVHRGMCRACARILMRACIWSTGSYIMMEQGDARAQGDAKSVIQSGRTLTGELIHWLACLFQCFTSGISRQPIMASSCGQPHLGRWPHDKTFN